MYKYKSIKNFLSYELWKFFMDIIATKVILIFISIFNYCNCNFDTVINIYFDTVIYIYIYIYIFTFYRFE